MARLKGLDLLELVGQMTASMLGIGVEGADAADDDGPRVVGCVHLTSEQWSGSILVAMGREVAVGATAAMFMLGAEDVDDELIADAVGELANVLAGQVKTEIGGGCQLSLPTVTSGAGLRMAVPGAQLVEEKWFASDLGRLSVATMETI